MKHDPQMQALDEARQMMERARPQQINRLLAYILRAPASVKGDVKYDA